MNHSPVSEQPPVLIIPVQYENEIPLSFSGKRRKSRQQNKSKATNFLRDTGYYAENRKTLVKACQLLIAASVIIVIGLLMTIVGYFDYDLTTTFIFNATLGANIPIVDDAMRYKLKAMQYIGPVLMGIGTFLLIVCCVITLESRDKHAQIIQQDVTRQRSKLENSRITNPSFSATKTSLLSPSEEDGNQKTQPEDSEFESLKKINDSECIITERTDDATSPTCSKFLDNDELPTCEIHSLSDSAITDSEMPKQRVKAEVHNSEEIASNEASIPQTQTENRSLPFTALVNNITSRQPKGKAPLVRVESVVELSVSQSLPPSEQASRSQPALNSDN
ncbi:hypothetical protein Ddc_00383 [Ditylenchus destructor]|nr:hypothetical protein Ddc_00383 [Ditylenchus destructor]